MIPLLKLLSAAALLWSCSNPLAPSLSARRLPTSTSCVTRIVYIATATQLTAAVNNAAPGDSLVLAPGTYTGHWTLTRSGSACAPIYLTGPRTAVLNGGSLTSGNGLFLKGVSYWTLAGFTVTNSLTGVAANGASYNTFSDLEVKSVGQEGIHLREFSKQNLVRGNLIHDTGKYLHQYGEGVYIGTAESQWCAKTSCQPDTSDSNQVVGNTIFATGADAIQFMAGTTGGLVRQNTLDGAGFKSDPSNPVWVLAMGNQLLVDSNTAVHALTHGMKVRRSSTANSWGSNNVFAANQMTVGTTGYAIYLETSPAQGTVVKCDNTRADAGKLSNLTCQP